MLYNIFFFSFFFFLSSVFLAIFVCFIICHFAQITIAHPIKIMVLLSCVADDTYRSLSSKMGVAKCNSDCSSVTVCPFDQSIGDSQKRGRGYVGEQRRWVNTFMHFVKK